jgi:hypothetical protein
VTLRNESHRKCRFRNWLVRRLASAAAAAFAARYTKMLRSGPFTLSRPDGTIVADQTYHGKWLLVYFGYTLCPNSCPTMLLDIATALNELGPDAEKVQPLFITIVSAARHAAGDSTIHRVIRPADTRASRYRTTDRGCRPGIWSVTAPGPASTNMSWTTVLTFTSWIPRASLFVPSTATRQARASPMCCADC